MPAQVMCRSEYQYAQRPIAFIWESELLQIGELSAEWRTPEGWKFRVKVEDGRCFELIYDELAASWEVQSL